jgi:putative ABC transport system permease protein
MTELRQDIGHAFRLLRRAPGFSALAIATLALGIAATTSIFTIVDSVLLRPLHFPQPHRLTMLLPSSGSRLSAEYFHDWRAESQAFDDMAAWYDERANMTGRGEPVEVLVDRVTSNFFDVLGAAPASGRTFTTEATLGSEPPEVVVSYGFWQRRFGGDPAAVGQTMTLDGEILTIVGVMPADFAVRTNELAESRAEIWRPFRLVVGSRSAGMGGKLNVIGRLAEGVTTDQAQAELSVIARRIEQQYRSYSSDWFITVVPLLDATVRDVRLMLLVLFGGVAILLVTACVNVANLVLSRSTARAAEFAVRRSLGATRWRLARQLLTEAAVLSMFGGALAIVLAAWGTDVLVSLVPPGLDLPRTREIGVSGTMLLFALLVTTLTVMLLGLVPSLGSERSAAAALREVARGSSTALRRNYTGSALIVSEVALALVLLAGAGLLSRSFWELVRVAPGFQSSQVMTLRVTLPVSKYDTDEKIRAFSRGLFERIERLPGIRAVGSVGYLPMSNIGIGDQFEIEGRPPVPPDGDRPGSWISTVGGRYFEAMRIPLIRGRLPRESDTEHTSGVFVIDEELARKYWANQDPIGARLIWREDDAVKLAGEVIGIVGRVRWAGRAASAQPTAYFWFPQDPGRELNIVARADGDSARLATLIAAQVREIDPNQPVGEVRGMDDYVSADLARPRFTMLLLTAFASAALLLAAIGLYGVIAFWVTQRTREIGVRVALGAEYRDVLRLVMRRGILLIGAGLVIGVAATLALGRAVAGLLYGIKPSDPATLAVAAFVLAGVAALATYVPARRAARVDPLVALRYE